MEIRIYEELPQSAAAIRTAVFMEEQGFVNEMDETDQVAVHLVMYDGEWPLAVSSRKRIEMPIYWADWR